MVFFFLFRPFFSSSLSFKRYTRRQRKKRERAETREDAAARKRRQQLQKNSGRKAVSLSSPQKLLAQREREREREKERQRESKKESAKNVLYFERNVFFFLCEKKKAHLSSHLISSHLCWKDYASRAAKRRKKRRRRRWWRRWW